MSKIPLLSLPQGEKLLLHSCCAPCSGSIIETLLNSGIDLTIYFYNPNIHPFKEYQIRKAENKHFAQQHHIPFIDDDYDSKQWFERTKGLENEPERGKRCTICFDMRLERTAFYAYQHSFKFFTSSLSISRWKNREQVNESGLRAADRYNLTYWTYNWRKQGGTQRMLEIAKQAHFYKQEYCGCIYSLRDMNLWRQQNGHEPIQIGVKYYSS